MNNFSITKDLRKENIAAFDGVFDIKTRILLEKYHKKGAMSELNRTISTGKEAHVFLVGVSVGKLTLSKNEVKLPNGVMNFINFRSSVISKQEELISKETESKKSNEENLNEKIYDWNNITLETVDYQENTAFSENDIYDSESNSSNISDTDIEDLVSDNQSILEPKAVLKYNSCNEFIIKLEYIRKNLYELSYGEDFKINQEISVNEVSNYRLPSISNDIRSSVNSISELDSVNLSHNTLYLVKNILRYLPLDRNIGEKCPIVDCKLHSTCKLFASDKHYICRVCGGLKAEKKASYTNLVSEFDKLIEKYEYQKIATGYNETVEISDWPILAALKIYKVSNKQFKNRAKYIAGDRRFAAGAGNQNSRNYTAIWARKEFRNLCRLERENILAPRPLDVKGNILVMTLLHEGNISGNPNSYDIKIAPKLADVLDADFADLYKQCLHLLRNMLLKAKLVHTDFCEYNLLVWYNKIAVIDVSQAKDVYSDFALEYLKKDINTINNYFKSRTQILTNFQSFLFITSVYDSSEGKVLDDLLEQSKYSTEEQLERDHLAFSLIADMSSLDDIYEKLMAKERIIIPSELFSGLRSLWLVPIKKDSASDTNQPLELDNCGTIESWNSSQGIPEGFCKKEWQKKIKEENREKRKNKIPKQVKNRLIKTTTRAKKN